MEGPKSGDVLFMEHHKLVIDQILHQFRIPRPPFTPKLTKPGFYDPCCTQNQRCSIFRTSGVGAASNLKSYTTYMS